MESTFGRPRYRLPPRSETVAALVELVKRTLADGCTPVIHAYPLGKSQEVTRILTLAGVPVLQHPAIFAVSQVYRQCGVDLGDMELYSPASSPDGRSSPCRRLRADFAWRACGER